jgi:hypothetical protein
MILNLNIGIEQEGKDRVKPKNAVFKDKGGGPHLYQWYRTTQKSEGRSKWKGGTRGTCIHHLGSCMNQEEI